MSPSPRRYSVALRALLGLFVLRVLGQLLVASGYGSFLPPWEEWFSGLVPYPYLLASQVILILAMGKICLDFSREQGFFVGPRRVWGSFLIFTGSLYAGVMVIRYVIRMALYPLERWTGGSIPIFFHWVLAAFVLVVGTYHRRSAPPSRSIAARSLRAGVWLAAAIAVAVWVTFELAPFLLTRALGSRPAEYAVRDQPMTMMTSDGVPLVAEVYRPVRAGATPTILVRIPFSKTFTNSLFASVIGRFWAERGYTAVIQGTRGRYLSGGHHYPLKDERRDGIETLAWLKKKPWFDGRLGMWGGSAFGYTQWAIADRLPAPPEGRSALMIQIASTDFHGMFYPGGAFSLQSALFWAMRSRGTEDVWPDLAALHRGARGRPLIEADDRAAGDTPFFNDWASHPDLDDYWKGIDGEGRAENLKAPVLLMGGWFDPFLPGLLSDFMKIRSAARPETAGTRLVIGPWAHADTVELPGNVQNRNYRLESLDPSIPWFDQNLRLGGRPAIAAPVRLFVMGANAWRDEQEWPLARARQTSFYLRNDGRLMDEAPSGDEPADTFRFDPQNPAPTRGGAVLGPGAGVMAQNEVEARKDVLVYSTAPLDADMEVTGPVAVSLYVSTSARNTDFTAKLVDVHENGTPYNVTDGILRRGYSPAAAPESIEIQLWPTSMVFRRGHRIRLEVSSSNFPRYDANPNTGEPIAKAVNSVAATQTVYHGSGVPSRLILPIVPREPTERR